MGCCGGKVSYRGRLDEIQVNANAAVAKPGDEGLEGLAGCAQGLREVLRMIVDAGATDTSGLRRVETLSETILGSLESRVTLDLLRRTDAQAVLDQLMAIAKDLDAVRATKASTSVEEVITKRREQIVAEKESKAKPLLEELRKTLNQITDVAQIMPGAQRSLQLIEKAHSEAPDSKKVTDLLLKASVELATKFMNFKAAWAGIPSRAAAVRDFATRLDATAVKLVAVMGATWDPPMLPQVERLVQGHAVKVCAELVANAEKETAKGNCGGAYDNLEALRPFWPELKGVGAVSLQVVGVFSKMETLATQDFLAASTAGDDGKAGAIREFAKKVDALRAAYEDLPPSPSGPLSDSLQRGEAKVMAAKRLDALDAELAKVHDDDKSTNLSLAATVQALEGLVAVWPSLVAGAAQPADRFQATCAALETWAEGAAAVAPASRVGALVGFAEEYDARRAKLVPPEPVGGPLRARIVPVVAEVYLKQVETELAKPTVNPNALLDALRSAAGLLLSGGGVAGTAGDELRARLSRSSTATHDRVCKTFREALQAGEVRKEEMLMQFATTLDEAMPASEASLKKRLEEERSGSLEGLVAGLHRAALGSSLPDTLQALRACQPWWPRVLVSPPHKVRVADALALLPAQAENACTGLADEAAPATALLQTASDIDEAVSGLGPEFAVKPSLRSRVLAPVAAARLEALAGSVGTPPGLQAGPVTRELEALGKIITEAGSPPALRERLQAVVSGPLAEAVMVRLLADGPTAEAGLGEVATAAGVAVGSGGLQNQLKAAKPVAAKLGEARLELQKPSGGGMDPRLVLQALRELEPIWPPVASSWALRQCLQETLGQLDGRLKEAVAKAVASGTDVQKRLQALDVLATDAEKVQEALSKAPPGFEQLPFRASVSQALADSCIGEAEAELAKESGMNAAALLKGVQGVASLWARAGQSPQAPALRARLELVVQKVRQRMGESMLEALQSQNQRKQQALMKFASDFDVACKDLPDVGGAGGLAESLKTKLEGKTSQRE